MDSVQINTQLLRKVCLLGYGLGASTRNDCFYRARKKKKREGEKKEEEKKPANRKYQNNIFVVSLRIDLPADLATNDLFPSSSVHISPGSVTGIRPTHEET